MHTGQHLIDGEWVEGAATFRSAPAQGEPASFADASAAEVDRAARAAAAAFDAFSRTSRSERAAFLDRIADEIEARADEITRVGSSETALPAALRARAADIGRTWAASLTLGVGQFCTNPGVVVLLDGPEGDAFLEAAAAALREVAPQAMLTAGIADGYRAGVDRLAREANVRQLLVGNSAGRDAAPALFVVDAASWLEQTGLGDEVFGPAGLVVRAADQGQMLAVAESLAGQLTCTLQLDEADTELARALLPILERKAGRILANGFPTGVEVCDAMVHGGPYPATTNFGATSVGTLAIRRFLRPVCYQNLPQALLPADL